MFHPRRTYPHRSNYPTHNKCCAYLREEGFSGFVVLVILGTSFIYLITILVVHLTSLTEVLVEEPDALSYLSITPAVQVVVAILGGMLLVRCIHVTAKVVCCRHYMQHKAIERLHGRRRSKWRIRRAYFWQRSWLGPTGPLVSFSVFFTPVQGHPQRATAGGVCVSGALVTLSCSLHLRCTSLHVL